MHLTGTEILDWIGLQRVHEGGVAMRGSGYVDWGRKVPCYLPEAFDRIAEAGLTSLLDVDCAGGLRRVVCTSRGRDRYQKLTAKRGRSGLPLMSGPMPWTRAAPDLRSRSPDSVERPRT